MDQNNIDNPAVEQQARADAEAEVWLKEQPECYKCGRHMDESYVCSDCGESIGCDSCMYLGDDGCWYCEYCIPKEEEDSSNG